MITEGRKDEQLPIGNLGGAQEVGLGRFRQRRKPAHAETEPIRATQVTWRLDPRQERSALVAPAGICAPGDRRPYRDLAFAGNQPQTERTGRGPDSEELALYR